MKSRRLLLVLTFIVTIFFMALYKESTPQSATLYKNMTSVLDAGSGKIFTKNYCIKISLGQPFVGKVGTNNILYSGFFNPKTAGIITSVEFMTNDVSLPKAYALHQNYPNPFNPETNIKYQLPEANHVILKVLNILGQEIKLLVDEEKEAGYFTVHWDGRNNFGEEVAGGVYFYRLITKDFINSKKMLLIR